MSKIAYFSKAIDVSIARASDAFAPKTLARIGIDFIAAAIDGYRAEVATEIEGLNKRLTNALTMVDEWKADAAASETKLDKAIEERDAALANLKQATEMYEKSEEDRQAWIRDYDKLRKDHESVKKMTPSEFREFWDKRATTTLGTDPGSPEGDKTLIVFECCNVKHTFSPPKSMQWSHTAECHECGAKTTINS